VTNLGDVGGWFRTATGVATPAWGPGDGGFGRVSPDADLTAALNLFRGRPTVVLTGAGMSTGSGLPDYRGRDAVPRSPMTFQEFTGSDLSRRRYWVRSTVGWNWFEAARPGLAHLALAVLGRHTPPTGVITQNVDGLHQAAGSAPVVDLHGNLARVVCLGCGRLSGRAELQVRLLELNPEVAARLGDLSERARTALCCRSACSWRRCSWRQVRIRFCALRWKTALFRNRISTARLSSISGKRRSNIACSSWKRRRRPWFEYSVLMDEGYLKTCAVFAVLSGSLLLHMEVSGFTRPKYSELK